MAAATKALDSPPSGGDAAEEYVVGLRWPEGVICPKCGAAEPAARSKDSPLKWRCRSCRKDFSVTTGTAMHGSKIGVAEWLAAVWSSDIRPPTLAREIGLSAPASRRMSAALEMTEEPPGESRLAALLTQHHDPIEAMRSRLPATLRPEDNPVADLTRGQRAVMGVLRNRIRGTAIEQIADTAGLAEEHVRSCLAVLAQRGYARCEDTSIPWGYGSLTVPLWSLNLTEECVTALAYLPRRPKTRDHACPDRVPPEFWSLFWNGSSAKDLSLPDASFLVASTLLGGPDPIAHYWALRCLPVDALQKCRTMRGYNQGEMAADIDLAIAQRSNA